MDGTQDGTTQLEKAFDRLLQISQAEREAIARYERGETSAGSISLFTDAVEQLWTAAAELGITERQLVAAGSP